MQTYQAPPASATRVADDGTTERIEFDGSEGERVFSCLYLPASRPRGAVVICPPLHGEFMRNYRREVLLARRLAHVGFAVERFHYRYSGNSDGDGGDLTFESMREDTLRRIDHIRGETDVKELFLVGTRWGGLIAASAAAEHPEAAIVLWAPLLDVDRFFREAFRSRLIKERKDGIEDSATRQELEARLRAGETVDAVASTIEPRLFQSSLGRSLETELGTGQRAVLLLQIGPTSTVRPDLVRQADRWRDAGIQVDIETVQGEETWWLIDERWHDESTRPMTVQLVKTTTKWMLAQTAEGGPR